MQGGQPLRGLYIDLPRRVEHEHPGPVQADPVVGRKQAEFGDERCQVLTADGPAPLSYLLPGAFSSADLRKP